MGLTLHRPLWGYEFGRLPAARGWWTSTSGFVLLSFPLLFRRPLSAWLTLGRSPAGGVAAGSFPFPSAVDGTAAPAPWRIPRELAGSAWVKVRNFGGVEAAHRR